MDDLVSFRGVSVAYLVELNDKLNNYEVCKGIHIFRVVEDLSNNDFEDRQSIQLRKGEVIRAIKRNGPRWFGYRKNGEYGWFPHVAVKERRRKDWNIEDVCEYALTKSNDKNDIIINNLPKEKISPEPYRGTLVSVSCEMKFSKLVSALQNHFKGRNLETEFVWLDMMGISYKQIRQDPGTRVLARKLVSNKIFTAFSKFSNFIVVIGNFLSPVAFRDKLCLWNIFLHERFLITQKQNIGAKAMEVVLPPYERDCLVEDIIEDFDYVINAILKIDINKTLFGTFGTAIEDEIERAAIDTTKINSVISNEIVDWLLKFTHGFLDEERRAKKHGWEARALPTTFGLCKLYARMGRGTELRFYFKRLCELGESESLGGVAIPSLVSILTNSVDEKAFYSGIKAAQISEAAHQSIVKSNLERLKKQREEYEKAKLEKYNEEQILLQEANEKNGKVREESHSRRDSAASNFVLAKHLSVPKIFRRLSRGSKDGSRHANHSKEEDEYIPIPTKIFRHLSRSSNGSRKADVDQSGKDLESRARLANRRSKRIEKILGSEASIEDIDYHSSRSH